MGFLPALQSLHIDHQFAILTFFSTYLQLPTDAGCGDSDLEVIMTGTS